jgi:hypothetical protein
MVISTPGHTRHDLVKVTAEYTVIPKRQYRIRAITFLQRYFQVQFAKLKTGLC